MKRLLGRWIFNILHERESSSVSQAYYQLYHSMVRRRIDEFKSSEYSKENTFFQVPGAGEIAISNTPHHLTGHSVGFGFDVSWSSFGFSGGVLGRKEAKRLAEFILKSIEPITVSEEDEWQERMSKFKK